MWIKVFLNDHSYVVVVNVLKSDPSFFRKMTDREDAIQLQSDINSLELWFEKWLVTLNSEKCHILTFNKFHNITHIQRCTLQNEELENFVEQNDLGFVLEYDLTFDGYLFLKIKKANTKLVWFRDFSHTLTAFFSRNFSLHTSDRIFTMTMSFGLRI